MMNSLNWSLLVLLICVCVKQVVCMNVERQRLQSEIFSHGIEISDGGDDDRSSVQSEVGDGQLEITGMMTEESDSFQDEEKRIAEGLLLSFLTRIKIASSHDAQQVEFRIQRVYSIFQRMVEYQLMIYPQHEKSLLTLNQIAQDTTNELLQASRQYRQSQKNALDKFEHMMSVLDPTIE
ncbi:hypothetical protein MP228_006944 [Amoeboaphelidium protococcarum]|nr:hypothetical protein MP228_006944 [Amoeboaphelidium protococcarum]